jgi:hypothetical protein
MYGRGTDDRWARRTWTLVTGLALLLTGLIGVEAGSAQASSISSVRSGKWTNPATWGGTPPTADQEVTISAGHTVYADPNADFVFNARKNIIVLGTLRMRPASPTVQHVIHFVDVNEAAFVGQGMDPVSSDVGLWVMGAGRLDIAGTAKTPWQYCSCGLNAGATSIPFVNANQGWRSGDDLVVTPTESPTVGSRSYTGFETRDLLSKSGNTVIVDPLAHAHPVVNGAWSPEVLNLSRNVRIEGEPGQHAHIFIRSTSPQTINYVELRYMGVERVSGRYPIHFHHSGDGSRGSQVVGTVVRDAGHHAFVTHISHGVTYKSTVAYNITGDAYWWDPTDRSNDILYNRVVAARILPGGSGVSTTPHFTRLAGIEFSSGRGNVAKNSVAVGVESWNAPAGFEWPEPEGGLWTLEGTNRTHNHQANGILTWQNTNTVHSFTGFVSFHNGRVGIDHGAYGNNDHFQGCQIYGNGSGAMLLRAKSSGEARTQIVGCTFDAAGLYPAVLRDEAHYQNASYETLVKDVTLKGAEDGLVVRADDNVSRIDLVCVDFQTSNDVKFQSGVHPLTRVRIQSCDGTTAELITSAGRVPIPPFYPY